MGFFKRKNIAAPLLTLSDLDNENEDKIKATIGWFLKNDSQVKFVASPTLQALFMDGFVPKSGKDNNPVDHYSNPGNLVEWFVLKTILNFKNVRKFNKLQLLKLLDDYSSATSKTIQISGRISNDYSLDPHNLSLDEMKKIPEEKQAIFMQNYIDDSVLSSEMRILAWVYFCSFGTHYKDDSNWTL